MPKAVRINAAGQVVALDNPVKVSKRDNEDVLWVATNNGGPWTITFGKQNNDASTYQLAPGSPFNGNGVYQIAQGASNGSAGGPVNGLVGRTYRYTITDAAGNITHDPDVDIET